MGRDVLILVPQGWYIDECCVNPAEKQAPTAALVMSAYLRKLGHRPTVHIYGDDLNLSFPKVPDALMVYTPWNGFRQWSAPVFQAFKRQFPNSTTILVMYESLVDFELEAMVECPDIDYAVLPNEKEISAGVILDHGAPRCTDGFGEQSGIAFRDLDGVPRSGGKRPFCDDLSHLPYFGPDLALFLKQYPEGSFNKVGVLIQRGCAGDCIFCPLRHTQSRYRDPDTVLDEFLLIQRLLGYEATGTTILESFREPAFLESFSSLILSKGVKIGWGTGARAEFVNDIGLLKNLKATGLTSLYFGIECATEETRRRIAKPIEDDHIRNALEITKEADLNFILAYIIGFPWEDGAYHEELRHQVTRLGSDTHCKRVSLSKLIPYSGLPVEKLLIQEGILERRNRFSDWQDRNKNTIVSKTNYLDTGQLQEAARKLSSRVNEMERHRAANRS
ncbi:MAG: radical SAM protein [Deltaproteobacteria bacterium]|nr:radical SAM protein [Deltaproteobacteria bacterium]